MWELSSQWSVLPMTEPGSALCPGTVIGYDRAKDVRRFPVSDKGIVLVSET